MFTELTVGRYPMFGCCVGALEKNASPRIPSRNRKEIDIYSNSLLIARYCVMV